MKISSFNQDNLLLKENILNLKMEISANLEEISNLNSNINSLKKLKKTNGISVNTKLNKNSIKTINSNN